MPIIWPEQDRGIALRILRDKGHTEIYSEFKNISRELASCVPIFITLEGEVVIEFSNYIYETWLYSGRIKSLKTVSTYAESLSSWLEFIQISALNWKTCKLREIASYRNWMAGNDSGVYARSRLANRTINLRVTVVCEFYKYYWRSMAGADAASKNIYEKKLSSLANTKGLFLRVNRGRPRTIPLDRCRQLQDKLNGAHRLVFLWTLCTGLRVSSVLALTVHDFKKFRDSESHFMKIKVKGGKQVDVYIPRRVVDSTDRYLSVGRCIDDRGKSNDRLFINSHGAPVTRHGYYKSFKKAANSLRLDCSPHSTRSTYASNLIEKLSPACDALGLDRMKIVQTLLGHSSSETTRDYIDSISICTTDVLKIIEDGISELAI